MPGDEADGFLGHGAYLAAQHVGQELVAQAEPQVSAARGDNLPDHGLQGHKVGKVLLLVDVGRTPQHYKSGEGVKGRQRAVPDLGCLIINPGAGQGRQQVPPGPSQSMCWTMRIFFALITPSLPKRDRVWRT